MITPVTVLNTLVILGAVVCAILTVTAKRTLSSIICLAGCGAFISLEFIMLQAPDVAIAEAAGYTRERFGVDMPVSQPRCEYYPQNRECLGRRCPFFPAEGE